jgi:transcriptional regulator with XRE-family HTH domain
VTTEPATVVVEDRAADARQLVKHLMVIRMGHGVSQEKLAKRVGVSQQVLSSWERGVCRPTRRSLRRWALALGQEPLPERLPVRDKCGTTPGYQVHQRRGEPPCDPCTDANTEFMRAYRAARRGLSTRPTEKGRS